MTTKTKDSAAPEKTGADQAEPKLPTPGNAISLLTPDKLKLLYASMLKCRMLENRVSKLSRNGTLSSRCRSYVGHEATAIATTIDLAAEDTLAPSHRDVVTDFMRGMPLTSLFAPFFPRQRSAAALRTSSVSHLQAITPASAIEAHFGMAAGIAVAYKLQKRSNVVLALAGYDSNSIGLWMESLRYAGVNKLPIVYVVEEDLGPHSVNENAVETLGEKLKGYGFPVITVDGNDAVAVYRVSSEALSRARNNGGPTLIDAKTSRWPAEDSDGGGERDPITHMEHYLKKRKLWSDDWCSELTEAFNRQIHQAIRSVQKSRTAEDNAGRVFSFCIRDANLPK